MRSLLVITSSYPTPSADGKEAAGSFVADFVEELANRVRVTVLAPGPEESNDNSGNFSVQRFAGFGEPLSLLNPLNPTHWRKLLAILIRGSRAAEDLAQRQKFDHTLALWALPCGYWARQLKRRHGIPYSVWALGSDIWSLGKIPLVRGVLRTVLRDSHVRLADGYLLRETVEKLAGRPCHFLPSLRHLAAPKNKQLRDRPPFRLAFLGRWHPNKGVDLLLDGLTLLNDEDWHRIEAIKICGGGPLESSVRSHGAVLTGAGRPVSVHGFLNKQQAVDLLAWADYVVIPSRIESIPVIFSDALQCGSPVISTPVGDLPRLIQKHNVGILAKNADAPAIATAIREATRRSPQSFAAHFGAARAEFSLPASCNRFLHLTDLASPHNKTHEPVSIPS